MVMMTTSLTGKRVTYNFKSVAGLTAELDAVGTNMDGYTGVLDRSVDTGAVFSLTKTF